MSEKQQHTAEHTRELMNHRYGDGLHHKHDKSHWPYRQHCGSHPVLKPNSMSLNLNPEINASTGDCRKENLQKLRKRFDKGRFH